MDDQIAFARCHAALEPVFQAVIDAQAVVAAVKKDAEAAERVHISAEIDAVATQLVELKSMTRHAQIALASVHAGQRDWCKVALWTMVLLALPLAFVGALEATGPSDANDYADDCESVSALTCFANVTILVWVCALLVRRKLLPVWWPRTHAAMAAAKRDKSTGYAIKTLFRFVVLGMLMYLLQYWSFDGLRMGGGPIYGGVSANVSAEDAIEAHEYCSGAHGVARRLWHSSKIFFLTIMVWELSFLPSSPWDMWLHHIGLILGVAFSTDHSLREIISGDDPDGPTERGEALDGFAYVLMLGTAFMFLKELLVLFFQHRKSSDEAQQYRDLSAAAIVHVVGQAAFYCLLPAVYLAVSLRRGHLPWGTGGLLIALLVVLNVLEAYIFSVTLKVMTDRKSVV